MSAPGNPGGPVLRNPLSARTNASVAVILLLSAVTIGIVGALDLRGPWAGIVTLGASLAFGVGYLVLWNDVVLRTVVRLRTTTLSERGRRLVTLFVHGLIAAGTLAWIFVLVAVLGGSSHS